MPTAERQHTTGDALPVADSISADRTLLARSLVRIYQLIENGGAGTVSSTLPKSVPPRR